jgi:hypothetical protein
MHDQSLEQKLRAALRTEGDQLAFTITAAELERRLILRRRGGMSPIASLGLAAAVGVGLLGLAGIAGGWFETRPVVAPSPSPVAIASLAPSSGPTASPSPAVLLPSIDDLVARLDPAMIVRAQSVGPAAGPSTDPAGKETGARGVTFAHVTEPGTYRLWTACLGDQLTMVVRHPDTVDGGPLAPAACDGSVTDRLIALRAGDALAFWSANPASWRIVLEAPARAALHATSIADIAFLDGDVILSDVRGASEFPDYGPTATGGGLWLPAEVGHVQHRDQYRVLVSCAGPRTIRYAFGQLIDQATLPLLPEDHSITEVECDGALHEDVLDLPLDEARIIVTSSDQNAWHIIVAGDPLPIALAKDEGGWTMSGGNGPDYVSAGHEQGVTLPGAEAGGDARVVISCSGDTTVTGSIDAGPGPRPSARPDPFTLDCRGPDGATLARSYVNAAPYVDVLYDPHGAPIWFAVTVQERAATSPAP